MTMPLVGATAQIDVEGWSVGGQRNDTSSSTVNLVDLPTVSCDPATLITQTTAQINATITGTLLAGGSARFVWGTPAPNTNVATTYSAGAVFANLTGLTANTTYAYRLEILDASGSVIVTGPQCTFTTSAVVAAPAATCSAATSVAQTGATLNGTLANIPAGGSAQWDYGTASGTYTGVTSISPAYANGAVTGSLGSLNAGTTYYYILRIFNAAGTNVASSGECSFTTLAAPPSPSASCSAGTGATQTGLTMNGSLANVPAGGSARFRYGTVTGGPYGTNIAATPYANGAVSANVTGLTASTTYYYILEVLDNTGTVVATSTECSGTTLAVVTPPTATCGGTSSLTQSSAGLQGNIQGTLPAGGSVRFSYGTALNGPYPNTVAASPYAVGGVNGNVTGLTPNTIYHYITEILDSSNVVVAASSDCSFATLSLPSAVCSAATAIATTSMTLNGALGGTLPSGGSSRFVYSTTSGGPYTGVSLALPYAVGAVSANITGLTPGTTYYYMLEMVDSSSVLQASSIECSANTAALPVVPAATCAAATGVAQTAATLNGTLANIPAGGSAVFRLDTWAVFGLRLRKVGSAWVRDQLRGRNNRGSGDLLVYCCWRR